jgi:hypothetical protein
MMVLTLQLTLCLSLAQILLAATSEPWSASDGAMEATFLVGEPVPAARRGLLAVRTT